jgi:hypothetical protein
VRGLVRDESARTHDRHPGTTHSTLTSHPHPCSPPSVLKCWRCVDRIGLSPACFAVVSTVHRRCPGAVTVASRHASRIARKNYLSITLTDLCRIHGRIITDPGLHYFSFGRASSMYRPVLLPSSTMGKNEARDYQRENDPPQRPRRNQPLSKH